jgi:hypothetical protein
MTKKHHAESNAPIKQKRTVTIPLAKLFADLRGDRDRTSSPSFDDAFAALIHLTKAYGQRTRYCREAFHRLRQLQWIVNRVWILNAEVGLGVHFGTGGSTPLVVELVTLTESAYYVAFRLKGVIEEIGIAEGNADCKNFNPKAIRDVRNHVLEHAVDPTFVFATGGSNGPQIKPHAKYAGNDKAFDRGLFPNVEEFLDQFARRLYAAASASAE